MRSYHGTHRRAIATSRDGGLTLSALEFDEALIEPVCEGSLLQAVPQGKKSGRRLLFSNPASVRRERITVRLSEDSGRTWKYSKVIYGGPAAYSDLVMLDRRSAGLLYEWGEKGPYERISFARLPLKWIEQA